MLDKTDNTTQSTAGDQPATKRHKRFEALEKRDVNQDGFVKEWPEVGLIAMGSPNDPAPAIRIENGEIVGMDGVDRADFDLVDEFVARTAIDASVAEQMMAMDATEIARKIVDINVSRAEVQKIFTGLTPAKIAAVMDEMNAVEMMMGLQKMRARRTPSTQGHDGN